MFLTFGFPEKIADILAFFFFEVFYLSIILFFSLILFTFIRVKYLDEAFAEKLSQKPKVIVYLGMAFLGIVSPFCSCSTIPVFISFSALGIPTGALFVFLITSPMVQETSLMLLLTQFGIPVAILYVILGTITGIIAGLLLSRGKDHDIFHENIMSKRLQKISSQALTTDSPSCCSNTSQETDSSSCCANTSLETDSPSCCANTSLETDSSSCCADNSCGSSAIDHKTHPFQYAVQNSKETFCAMFRYILLGIGLGAMVYGFIPDTLIQRILGTNNLFAPVLATLVGIPTYADDVALIPIAKTLVDSGAGLGTALAFVMSSAIVSFPSFIMLSSALQKKTLVKLALCLTIAITIIGYVLNVLAPFVI